MTEAATDPTVARAAHPEAVEKHQLRIEDSGAVKYGQAIVGEIQEGKLTINLAWARLAGLGVVVEGDSKRDKRRIVLSRP